MDFNKLTKDLERLDKINKDLEEINKPEYIKKRVQEIFGNREKTNERYKKEIEKIVNMYL